MHKLVSGGPLKIYASDWNTIIDAIEAVRKSEENHAYNRSAIRTYVQVYNPTNAVATEGSVWELGMPVISPSSNLEQFQKHPVFNLKVPTADTAGILCALTAPVNANEQGIGVVTGGVAVFASVGDSGASRAMPDGQGGLVAGADGPIQLAYADQATGWCYAILGAGGGGSAYNGYFAVSIKTVENVKYVHVGAGKYFLNGQPLSLPAIDMAFMDNTSVLLKYNKTDGGYISLSEPSAWSKTETCTVLAEISNGTIRQICHDMPSIMLIGKCGEDSA